MGFLKVACLVGLLVTLAQSQDLQNCSVDTVPSTVATTEDAANLATALECSNGDFAVQWVGEVIVAETIRVTGGASLNITGDGPGATVDGQNTTQLFFLNGGSRLHLSGMAIAHGNASIDGGAIYAEWSSVSLTGNTWFISNSAGNNGGAIYLNTSTLSWAGDGIEFNNNFAAHDGGAISADFSTLSWAGDGIEFNNNFAAHDGGAISADFSNVSWYGDGTNFIYNFAAFDGGAIYGYVSTVSWDGDGTNFINNSAAYSGGVIYAIDSNVSWEGDGTKFRTNTAEGSGGAIFSEGASSLSWGGPTTLSRNIAGGNGGAVALTNFGEEQTPISYAVLIENSARNGGAFYLHNCLEGFTFAEVTFQSNSASDAGGAIEVNAGTEGEPKIFRRCTFLGNKATNGTGGAFETLSGIQNFDSCDFEGNSADIGGAMRLGGSTSIDNCSFSSNSASTRGLAIAVVDSTSIIYSSFDGNEWYCAAGSYRKDAEEEGNTRRYTTVCLDCPAWDECLGCDIARGNVTSSCEAPLEHTTADKPGVTLETLDINSGYWRATNRSENILACYNADACIGGQTASESSSCAPGYEGPYCAVCETGYSPSLAHTCTRCSGSTRQGLVAATAIAALFAIFAMVAIFKYLLSTEIEERNIGCFHRKVLRALPVQALKIIIVVWQILTQFADAANVTYPGVYQDFLSAIDVVNFNPGSVLAAGCLWSGIDFHDRLLLSTIGPLVAVGFLAMTYGIAMRRNGSADNTVVEEKIRHRHQTALLLLTFLVYSSVSAIVFQTFACETLDDGIEYLRADYRIHCTDAKHKVLQVYAGIMVLYYPVGIPLLYAILLYQRRDVLADAHADKSSAQAISGLWESYKPQRFYYEVVECGRRIMLTGVVVFIFPNDAAQIAITLLIAFFFFAVFEVLSPYECESEMWLSRGGHVIVFLTMFDLLLLKVDVSGESDQSQAVFAGVLVAGHVLMVLVIVVEVVGICYASKKKRVVEVSSDSLPGSRSRAGSDDAPVFESVPASWRSFMRQGSVSAMPGPTRSASGTVVSVGQP